MSAEHRNLLIRIHGPAEGGRYAVEAELDDGSRFRGGALSLAGIEADPTGDAGEQGAQLSDALFRGPIARAFTKASTLAAHGARARAGTGAGACDASAGRLHIRLAIDESAAELHAHRWERLRAPDGSAAFLSARSTTPLSRYIALESEEAPPVAGRGLRMLVAFANPTGLDRYGCAPIDVGVELDGLRDVLDAASHTGHRFEISILPGRTGLGVRRESYEKAGYRVLDGATSLGNLVRLLEGTDVLHFVGHGAASAREEDAFSLFLEAEADGSVARVRDDELCDLLGGLGELPRLMFLASCQSGARDAGVRLPFVGLGPKLVRSGVAATVAMQARVSVRAAQQLAGAFYRGLFDHGIVDQALADARGVLRASGCEAEFDVPVLFMRLQSGTVFAPDPVRRALESLCADPAYALFAPGNPQYIPLPIEAVHLVGDQARDRQDLDRRRQAEMAATSSVDLIVAIEELMGLSSPTEAEVLVLVSPPGFNGSSQMRRFTYDRARRSLLPGAAPMVLPAYMALGAMPRALVTITAQSKNVIEPLILEALRPHWPGLDEATAAALIAGRSPQLRLIIDGLETLPRTQRELMLGALEAFALSHPQHEFVVQVSTDDFSAAVFESLGDRRHVLALQPLSPRKVTFVLRALAAIEEQDRKRSPEAPSPVTPSQVASRAGSVRARDPYASMTSLDQDEFATIELEAQEENLTPDDIHAKPTQPPRDRDADLVPCALLLRRIEENLLFDLAAIPRFLIRMIRAARAGRLPGSRTTLMAEEQEDLRSSVPMEKGMRGHVAAVLESLAITMSRKRVLRFPLAEAFTLMAEIRGRREYQLQELLDALTAASLLRQTADDDVTFAYPTQQAYWCAHAIAARPDRLSQLDDITATFGRPSRLRWWADTVVYLSDLLAGTAADLADLVWTLRARLDPFDGEQRLLSLRCLVALRDRARSLADGEERRALEETFAAEIDDFGWFLQSGIEGRGSLRERGLELIGHVGGERAWPLLVRIITARVRRDRRGQMDFELASVRAAAAIALRKSYANLDRHAPAPEGDPVVQRSLFALLDDWLDEGALALERLLDRLLEPGRYPAELRPIAAIALADREIAIEAGETIALQAAAELRAPAPASKNPVGKPPQRRIFEALRATFLDPLTDDQTRWAVTRGLSLVHSPAVERIIRRFVTPAMPAATSADRDEHIRMLVLRSPMSILSCLIHLIGRTRSQHRPAQTLVERCLQRPEAPLFACVIEAFGWLGDASHRRRLEALASGDPSLFQDTFSEEDTIWLRGIALHALGGVGDIDQLRRIMGHPDAATWPTNLRRAFVRAARELESRDYRAVG